MSKFKVSFGTMVVTDFSRKLINEILDSNKVSSGKYVRQFEERFAKLLGVKEAVAVSSGSDAVTLALAVLYDYDAKRNDEIILPALSFIATGNAVLHAGFKPVFVDIDKKTLNIDPKKIEKVITKKTRAILPVHLMGKPCDMEAIKGIAKEHKLWVIEDAAEAHGAQYKGKNIGTLGAMAAFSLYVAHIITTVEGGIIVTNSAKFAEILRSLRAHGRACKCQRCVLNIASGRCPKRFQYGKGNDIRFIFERIGYSAKMNELEAAIGLGNLNIYDEILEKRRQNLIYLLEGIKKFHPYLYSIEEDPHEKIGPHAFGVILNEKVNFTRDKLVNYLDKQGIDTRNLFSSMPTQCAGFSFLGYRMGDFPHAEYIGNNGFHLGVHQDLSKSHLDYILDTLNDFLSKQLM